MGKCWGRCGKVCWGVGGGEERCGSVGKSEKVCWGVDKCWGRCGEMCGGYGEV